MADKITTVEQETIINFTRTDQTCIIFTSDSTIMTKLDKIYKRYKEHKDISGKIWAVEYKVNKKLISFRSGKRKAKVTDDSNS